MEFPEQLWEFTHKGDRYRAVLRGLTTRTGYRVESIPEGMTDTLLTFSKPGARTRDYWGKKFSIAHYGFFGIRRNGTVCGDDALENFAEHQALCRLYTFVFFRWGFIPERWVDSYQRLMAKLS